MRYHEDCTELETFKDLNVRSLRNGVSSVLFMYYLIRSVDKGNKGFINHTDFINYLETLKLTRNNFYTALNNPACHIFFTYVKDQNTIVYKSLHNVCEALNVKPGITVHIQLHELKSLKIFNSFMYGSLFKTRTDKLITMSRDIIKSITGLSIQCQLNYEQVIELDKQFNLACAIIPEHIVGNKELTNHFIATLPLDNTFYTVKGRKIVWQMPNSYKARHMRVYKGKKHRANKSVNLVDESPDASANGKQAKSSKIVYNDVTANTMFTDQANSFVRTHYDVPTPNGTAKLYRFNNYAPTKNHEDAVPYARINQHGIVTVQQPKPSDRITVETI